MKNKIVLFGCLLVFALTNVAFALPTKCLQAPERKNVCPHLIYKQAALTVAKLDVEKGEVICICLSDLKALRHTTSNKVEKTDQQVTLQRIADKYQLSEQDILTLLKH